MTDALNFSMSPWELLVRGTVVYWFLFLVFRFVLRRDVGSAGISDILFVVLLGDASQNAMIGEGTTVADGLMLISTLVAWNYALDYLAYHLRFFEWLTAPPPICLVRNGRYVRRNLRSEHLTPDEIDAKLRAEGIDECGKVKAMYLEADGSFSVLRRRRR